MRAYYHLYKGQKVLRMDYCPPEGWPVSVMKEGTYDVIAQEWVNRCVRQGGEWQYWTIKQVIPEM